MTIENQIKVVAALKAGKAKIADPANWTTEVYARNKDGGAEGYKSEAAVCYCSDGALLSVAYKREDEDVYQSAYSTLCGVSDGNIILYNDAHTHAEVMAVWDKAIQKAEDKLVVLNLERLIAAVDDEPEVNFNLASFKEVCTDDNGEVCGTLFCTVGLACTLPEFQAQNFELCERGASYKSYFVEVNGEHIMSNPPDTNKAFGEDAFTRLFNGRDDGIWDEEHEKSKLIDDEYGAMNKIDKSVTDKELALWRLNKQLAIYKEKV